MSSPFVQTGDNDVFELFLFFKSGMYSENRKRSKTVPGGVSVLQSSFPEIQSPILAYCVSSIQEVKEGVTAVLSSLSLLHLKK